MITDIFDCNFFFFHVNLQYVAFIHHYMLSIVCLLETAVKCTLTLQHIAN